MDQQQRDANEQEPAKQLDVNDAPATAIDSMEIAAADPLDSADAHDTDQASATRSEICTIGVASGSRTYTDTDTDSEGGHRICTTPPSASASPLHNLPTDDTAALSSATNASDDTDNDSNDNSITIDDNNDHDDTDEDDVAHQPCIKSTTTTTNDAPSIDSVAPPTCQRDAPEQLNGSERDIKDMKQRVDWAELALAQALPDVQWPMGVRRSIAELQVQHALSDASKVQAASKSDSSALRREWSETEEHIFIHGMADEEQ
jgi:hypothetical protein